MFERIRRINFTERFIGSRQDPGLPAKIQLELPVILRWAFEGYRRYALQGLQPPAPVVAAGRAYALRHDALGRFIAECCVEHTGASVAFAELRAAWEKWRKINDGPELSAIKLSQSLERRGYRRTRTRRVQNGLAGIGLLRSSDDNLEDHLKSG